MHFGELRPAKCRNLKIWGAEGIKCGQAGAAAPNGEAVCSPEGRGHPCRVSPYPPSGAPPPAVAARLTNLKTCVCVLINFTYKSVKYFNFLGYGAVRVFDGFVYDYFLDERIKHLGGQLYGLEVLLD